MKKTQPIDWDKVIFDDRDELSYIWIMFEDGEIVRLDKYLMAAFDEMLENQIKKRISFNMLMKWDNIHGWIPKWKNIN